MNWRMLSLMEVIFLVFLAYSGTNTLCHALDEKKEHSSHEDDQAISLEGFKLLDGEPSTGTVVTEQDKIDMMVRSLSHLPEAERERLGIDIDGSVPILAGSVEAEILHHVWTLRQQELRDVMAEVMKPAELMASLAKELDTITVGLTADSNRDTEEVVDSDAADAHRVQILHELEDLLSDVDNARDFHTIGAWPSLVSMLLPEHRMSVRTAAAWAIGTAVKNDYSYQLWTLENITFNSSRSAVGASTGAGAGRSRRNNWIVSAFTRRGQSSSGAGHVLQNVTCIELLVEQLAAPATTSSTPVDPTESTEMQKKALYALASAIRGNIDIQEAILNMPILNNQPRSSSSGSNIRFLSYIESLLQTGAVGGERTSAGVVRKIWTMFVDLLEERAFIREDLTVQLQQSLGNPAPTMTATDTDDAITTGAVGRKDNNTSNAADLAAAQASDLLQDTQNFLREVRLLGDAFVVNDTRDVWPSLAVEFGQSYWDVLKETVLERHSLLSKTDETNLALRQYSSDIAALGSILNFCKALVSQRAVLVAAALAEPTLTSNPPSAFTRKAQWKRTLKVLASDILSVFQATTGDSSNSSDIDNSGDSDGSSLGRLRESFASVIDTAEYLHAVM